MAVVTSDILAGALTNFRVIFDNAFDAARNLSPWRQLAYQIESTRLTESHNWLGTVPVMVDVTHGDIQVEGLGSYNFPVTNTTYKGAVEVQRSFFEDDALGMFRPKMGQLGEEAARHPGQLLFQMMVANPNAFDGTAFFADTRVIGRSANIDNNLAKTGQTIAAIQTDIALVRAAMRKFQDDQGRPMNNTPNVFVIPPELEQVFYQALTINFPAAAPTAANVIPATNDGSLQAAGYTVIVNPYATDATTWWAFAVTAQAKPFIFQNRISPALEGITSPETESGVIRDRFVYSVRARYAVAFSDPRFGVKVA